ncbi:hypothetical protein A3Q56_04380 [Intoshia linei]|uniref:Uncharacterized protein n=1 Tax=Intoshia linei TaxID=1819745 RepID=A0A177B384_9BILA|nr:hypothetical protein A3Q56_04380 [Intoshia linei]
MLVIFKNICYRGSVNDCYSDKINIYKSIEADSKGKFCENCKNVFPFYTGNGYIGFSQNSNIMIKNERSLSHDTLINPHYYSTIDVNAIIVYSYLFLSYDEGSIKEFYCYKTPKNTYIWITRTLFAHCTETNLIYQQFDIENFSYSTINVKLDLKNENIFNKISDKYRTASLYKNDASNSDKLFLSTVKSQNVNVAAYGKKTSIILSILHNESNNNSQVEKILLNSKNFVELEINHKFGWQQLKNSRGFYIGPSKMNYTVNVEDINRTIYYILTQSSFNHVQEFDKSLIGQCYSGHDTLQNYNLWREPYSMTDLNALLDSWLITLEKQGCQSLLNDVHGTYQAILYSIGSFSYRDHHLEMNVDPNIIERNFTFFNISLSKMCSITIQSTISIYTYMPHMLIKLNLKKHSILTDEVSNACEYYACGTGCVNTPVILSKIFTQIPLYSSKPKSALLYVTHNNEHIRELKLAIHVREINLVTPIRDEIMYLHKYGYERRIIPLWVWMSIVLFVIFCHIAIFHLLLSEFKNSKKLPVYNSKITKDHYLVSKNTTF